ncbi:hypothetical protein EDI_178880 [Entamoeba dispar SAW760]|uniref:Uncharacterized protein n=1 Tax=Entamoeba dispar (strain ATCC PRA-260 / SAW760) TaxID=370354 RepID=B0EFQ7_ENTDS|nr:uncharacterized protein EDI_178880 [Entamoeba dispar SAW760]EDR26638.1 hypothetical protein EDI_178880 [Entamoeba dispar SAW760]|eukprot:EDR26638.1 hypothetical protein EDI_178880 [Entamoeba dispar SAW760]
MTIETDLYYCFIQLNHLYNKIKIRNVLMVIIKLEWTNEVSIPTETKLNNEHSKTEEEKQEQSESAENRTEDVGIGQKSQEKIGENRQQVEERWQKHARIE